MPVPFVKNLKAADGVLIKDGKKAEVHVRIHAERSFIVLWLVCCRIVRKAKIAQLKPMMMREIIFW